RAGREEAERRGPAPRSHRPAADPRRSELRPGDVGPQGGPVHSSSDVISAGSAGLEGPQPISQQRKPRLRSGNLPEISWQGPCRPLPACPKVWSQDSQHFGVEAVRTKRAFQFGLEASYLGICPPLHGAEAGPTPEHLHRVREGLEHALKTPATRPRKQ
ncbi:unnamed protein product, partial [Gulo gulo]